MSIRVGSDKETLLFYCGVAALYHLCVVDVVTEPIYFQRQPRLKVLKLPPAHQILLQSKCVSLKLKNIL